MDHMTPEQIAAASTDELRRNRERYRQLGKRSTWRSKAYRYQGLVLQITREIEIRRKANK